MAEPTPTARTPLDDICPKHKTPMIKHQVHVGGGNTEWSEPYCPLCKEIEEGRAKDLQTTTGNEIDPTTKAAAGLERPAGAALSPGNPAAPAAKPS